MKLNIAITFTFIISTLFSCENSGEGIFTDEKYHDTLQQNIGGYLVRNIHHYNDFHSFNYDINYSYVDKLDSIYTIGFGSFYGQEPPSDEQLIRFGKWIILKTSGDRDKDFLFIGDINNSWTRYEISPETIEQKDLWKAQQIKTRTDNWDAVAKVSEIKPNGDITVVYTFVREKFIPFFKTGKREIIFNMDKETGKLEMTKIKD